MKIVGQDSDGRLIIDCEGEAFMLTKPIPGGRCAVICNGMFSSPSIIDANSDYNTIPVGSYHSSFTSGPYFGVPYLQLKVVNPADPKTFKIDVEDEIVEITDPIEDRFGILDL